ncbi:hypothetical protein ABID26_004593 [Mesorhizobium shonense]|uniref:Uncharacterized protein n=1 Tax=Mesorhizobium shonense TaxID=1209948 RepID=A0ABV2HX24_9HYPH|nr:hypothetical protein [Mesorhizobium sp.]
MLLLHVPIDLDLEDALEDTNVKSWLAFAAMDELVVLSRALSEGRNARCRSN